MEETMEPTRWNRRGVLWGLSAMAGAGILGASTTRATAQQVKYSSGTEPPKLKVPANACDCHHHIYGSQYKVDPRATLRPGDATVDDYRALQKRIGTSRNVIVQPSTYGTENAPTLDALVAFGPSARAVVVVDTTVTDAELKRMHGLGARGIRFNLAQARGDDARNDRAAVKAGQRTWLAYPDQRFDGHDHGDHTNSPKSAATDRVRPSCSYPRAGRDQPSALRPGPGTDRQGQDLGQAVRRLCRHQSGAADLFRLERSRPRLRQGGTRAASLGQRLATPGRARSG